MIFNIGVAICCLSILVPTLLLAAGASVLLIVLVPFGTLAVGMGLMAFDTWLDWGTWWL